MHRTGTPTKTIAPHNQSLPLGPLIAVGVGNVALAFGPLFVRLADVGPVASAFWRITLAAPVLLAAALVIGRGRPMVPSKGLWWVLLLSGLAFAADLAAWHLGILRTTLANSTLFGNSATLIFPIYGFLAARMWPSRPQAAALLLAAVGAALLMGRSAELSPRNLAGDLLCLLAGVLYAGYFILMARVRESMASMPALALSTIASAPPLLLSAWLIGESVWPGNWWPLVGVAVMSQLIGQGLLIYALGHLPPLVIGIALLVQPIVSATTGWIVYGERLSGADYIGAALVAAALVLVRGGSASTASGVAPAPQATRSER